MSNRYYIIRRPGIEDVPTNHKKIRVKLGNKSKQTAPEDICYPSSQAYNLFYNSLTHSFIIEDNLFSRKSKTKIKILIANKVKRNREYIHFIKLLPRRKLIDYLNAYVYYREEQCDLKVYEWPQFIEDKDSLYIYHSDIGSKVYFDKDGNMATVTQILEGKIQPRGNERF